MLASRMSDSRRKKLVATELDRLRIGVGEDDDEEEERAELGFKAA